MYRLKKELKDENQFENELPKAGVSLPFPGARKLLVLED